MSTPDALALKAAIEHADTYLNNRSLDRYLPDNYLRTLLAAARQLRTALNVDRTYEHGYREAMQQAGKATRYESYAMGYKAGQEAMGTAPDAEDLKRAVDKFLAWRLPEHFSPDCGISFDGRGKDAHGYDKGWPIGTNLFTADQARAMFEHCLTKAANHAGAVPQDTQQEQHHGD